MQGPEKGAVLAKVPQPESHKEGRGLKAAVPRNLAFPLLARRKHKLGQVGPRNATPVKSRSKSRALTPGCPVAETWYPGVTRGDSPPLHSQQGCLDLTSASSARFWHLCPAPSGKPSLIHLSQASRFLIFEPSDQAFFTLLH